MGSLYPKAGQNHAPTPTRKDNAANVQWSFLFPASISMDGCGVPAASANSALQ
jgi:hypothetical protein